MEKSKDMYLKLTEDEVEVIKHALHFQNDVYSSNSLNFDGSENDNLVTKIVCQEHCICRPYVVIGVHDNSHECITKRVIIMAEDIEAAIEYAKEKLEKTSGGAFKVNPENVHEMTDDEFSVEKLCY